MNYDERSFICAFHHLSYAPKSENLFPMRFGDWSEERNQWETIWRLRHLSPVEDPTDTLNETTTFSSNSIIVPLSLVLVQTRDFISFSALAMGRSPHRTLFVCQNTLSSRELKWNFSLSSCV
jgi:hypothetical protein